MPGKTPARSHSTMASSSSVDFWGGGRGAPEPAAKAQRTGERVKEEPTRRLKVASWNVGAVKEGQQHEQCQQPTLYPIYYTRYVSF